MIGAKTGQKATNQQNEQSARVGHATISTGTVLLQHGHGVVAACDHVRKTVLYLPLLLIPRHLHTLAMPGTGHGQLFRGQVWRQCADGRWKPEHVATGLRIGADKASSDKASNLPCSSQQTAGHNAGFDIPSRTAGVGAQSRARHLPPATG